MISKNLGKTIVNWDDLLKCFQQELSLSYTVLKAQNKKYSISQAKWNNSLEFNKIIQYIKLKETNAVQKILKPNLNINISTFSNVSDILAVAFQKEIMFYVIQDNLIANNFQFKYQNVQEKIIKKQNDKQVKMRELFMQKQSFDRVTPINNFKMNSTHYKSSQHVQQKSKRSHNKFLQQDSQKLSRRNSRLHSSASSQISGLKRTKTQIGAGDWRRRTFTKNQPKTVKIRTNTTKKVFQYFQEATLQNSITIANAFVQSRNSFQKYMEIDKNVLQKKQYKQQIGHIQSHKQTKNYQVQLEKMKRISKSLTKDRKFSMSTYVNRSKQEFDGEYLFTENKLKSQKIGHTSSSKQNTSKAMLLEDSIVGIVSFSFHQNYLLVSLVNREVRLYKVKKNLHRLKQELVYQKVSDNISNFVLLYKSIFKDTLNMVISTSKNQSHLLRVYQIPSQILFTGSINFKQPMKQTNKKIKQIFSCQINFCPILQQILPYGVAGFNQKGNLAVIGLNSTNQQSSQTKLFQKNFTNLTTGARISFCGCRIHANMLNIYMICNNGWVYLIDRVTASIKLQRKLSVSKLLDIILIKSSSQLLIVSQKGELCIVNSFNLQVMYNFQSYTHIEEDTRLLSIQQNKILVYNSKDVGVVQLQQNVQKLFQYQKPLKIYKNRVKLKQQNKLQDKNAKRNVAQQAVAQSLTQYKSIKKSNKILFVSSPVSEHPYIMIGLQRGQIMVYNQKLDYVGSYLIPIVSEIIQCRMNKKLHYLAVHYESNAIQIVNLYNQNVIAIIEQDSMKKQQSKVKSKLKQRNIVFKDQLQIQYINISFFSQHIQAQFFVILTSLYNIQIYDRKGVKTKVASIAEYYTTQSKQIKSKGNQSQFQIVQKTIKIKSSLFRNSELIVGSEKGDILIHQKQNFSCKKSIKLSYYPIVDIRLLNLSYESYPNKKSVLCQSQNNHIFLLNAQNHIFKSVYVPQNDLLGLNLKGFNENIVVYDHQQNYQIIKKTFDKDQKQIQKVESHVRYGYVVERIVEKINSKKDEIFLPTFTTQQFTRKMCSFLFLPKDMLITITQNQDLIVAKTYSYLKTSYPELLKQTILK